MCHGRQVPWKAGSRVHRSYFQPPPHTSTDRMTVLFTEKDEHRRGKGVGRSHESREMKRLVGKSLAVKRKEVGTLGYFLVSAQKACLQLLMGQGVGGKPEAELWKGHGGTEPQANAASKRPTEQLWR